MYPEITHSTHSSTLEKFATMRRILAPPPTTIPYQIIVRGKRSLPGTDWEVVKFEAARRDQQHARCCIHPQLVSLSEQEPRNMDLALKGKVAAITGGSVGIGLAVAQALAQEGVNIAICARQADRVVDEARDIALQFGVKAIGVQADVSKAEDIDRFVSEIKHTFDGADILINNAGTGSEEKIMDAPDEKWQYYWDLHVMAAIRLSRGIAPFMQARGGGVILNNASICATQPLGYEL